MRNAECGIKIKTKVKNLFGFDFDVYSAFRIPHSALNQNSGAVLIGAVVMTLVLAIAAAGLIGLSRNAHNQNFDSHTDTRAFLAAEAGLYAGTKWYRSAEPPPAPGTSFTMTHDGVPIKVEVLDGDNTDPTTKSVRITSVAYIKELPYQKMVEWEVSKSEGEGIPSGYFSYFIDKSDYGTSDSPINKKESAYDGFRRSCVFDGPVHFNEPLWMSRSDKPVFRSILSIYNPPKEQGGFFNDYGVGKKGDYSRGGLKIGGDPNIGKVDLTETPLLDAVIGTQVSGKALIIQDEKYTVSFRNPENPTAPIAFDANGVGVDAEDGMVWNRLPKPTTAAFITGSFLKFGVNGTGTTNGTGGTANTAQYTFYEQIATSSWKPHPFNIPQDTTAGGGINPLIIYADFPLTVRDGKMKGKVSVRTTDGNDIIFDLKTNKTNGGNLIYDNSVGGSTYTSAIAGVPNKQSSTDAAAHSNYINLYKEKNYGMDKDYLMAFYSGKNIDFVKYDEGTKVIITGQIFAKNGQVVVPYSGSLKNCINIIGACVTKYWWNYSGNANKDDTFRVWHDPRTMSAPGVSLAGSEGGDGQYGGGKMPDVFTKINYKETNFAKLVWTP